MSIDRFQAASAGGQFVLPFRTFRYCSGKNIVLSMSMKFRSFRRWVEKHQKMGTSMGVPFSPHSGQYDGGNGHYPVCH
jgi:hypothetical protein